MQYSDGKTHEETVVIILNNILHHEKETFFKDFLQDTSVNIEDESALYFCNLLPT